MRLGQRRRAWLPCTHSRKAISFASLRSALVCWKRNVLLALPPPFAMKWKLYVLPEAATRARRGGEAAARWRGVGRREPRAVGAPRAWLRIDLDLRGQVGLGVGLLVHVERRHLRVAQVRAGVRVEDAARERLLVLAVGPCGCTTVPQRRARRSAVRPQVEVSRGGMRARVRVCVCKAAPSATCDPSRRRTHVLPALALHDCRARVLAARQHLAGRHVGILQELECDEAVIRRRLGIVENIRELLQVTWAQQVRDIHHRSRCQEPERLGLDLQHLLATDLKYGDVVGRQLPKLVG